MTIDKPLGDPISVGSIPWLPSVCLIAFVCAAPNFDDNLIHSRQKQAWFVATSSSESLKRVYFDSNQVYPSQLYFLNDL
jgi:hypothetical protein